MDRASPSHSRRGAIQTGLSAVGWPGLSVIEGLICREPYRLFFPLGICMGTVGVSPWLFYAFGWTETYSGFFHSSVQMLVYMNCFMTGFLTTFIPRVTGTSFAALGEILSFLLALLGALIFLCQGNWVMAEGCYVLWLAFLAAFMARRLLRKRKEEAGSSPSGTGAPPVELVWIPVGLLQGIGGTLLLILGQLKVLSPVVIRAGKPMMEQGFLLSVVIGIGGFLLPRIMGSYRQGRLSLWGERSRILVHGVCVIGLLLSFAMEGMGYLPWGYGLRALIVTVIFYGTGIFQRVGGPLALYAWLARISAWMIAAGLWTAAFFSAYRVAVLHISFIGGFSLMTFAVATMVVMSHAGAGERLRQPLWILWAILLGLALAVVKRVMVIFYPDVYHIFLGLASSLWVITALGWLGFMAPYLLKAPDGDEFERMHEEAKRQVVQS